MILGIALATRCRRHTELTRNKMSTTPSISPAKSSPELSLASHFALPAAMIPADVRDAGRAALLDTLGCMVAGVRSSECRAIIQRHLDRGGKPESTIVSAATRVPAAGAATANAALAHWFEWDDLHDEAVVHPSAVIWPVLLAAAEASGADRPDSGTEVLAAAVIAYDIASRVGSAITPKSHTGWYATGYSSAIGATAGAARVLGMSPTTALSAMGLAATAAGFSRQPLLDRVNGKNALCAQVASTVFTALELAQAGVLGAHNFLAGEYGLNELLAHGSADIHSEFAKLGHRFAISEVSVKPYPCCRATHQAIDLALQLRATDPDVAQKIAHMHIRVPRPIFEMVGAPFEPGENPRVSAQFSIPYTTAVALTRGRPTLSDFDAANVSADPNVLALARKIHVEPFALPPGERLYDAPTELSCETKAGGMVHSNTDVVIGSPQYPLSVQDREQKFLDCTRDLLPSHTVNKLIAAVNAIEHDGLEPILTSLRGVRIAER